MGIYCSSYGPCMVEETGPRCICDSYSVPSDDGLNCLDIDECLVDNGGCDPLTECTDYHGYVTCGACPYGYQGDGETGCVETWQLRCTRNCEFENECFGPDRFMGFATGPDCTAGCAGLDFAFTEPCAELYVAVGDCERTLGCEGAMVFAEDYGAHPQCGPLHTELISTCGIDGGAPRAGCLAFCAKAELCVPTRVVGGCLDNCSLTLGIYDTVWGPTCSSRTDDYFGCIGALSCSDFPPTPTVVPSACASAAQAGNSECR